ncbi:MAG: hypothetical protein ISS15_05535 [Alphaproteobacteria bacterium]|nr:hypothetical protein [Alphaproteobacteria bacterium]MBL6939417.1 hypothetical protein [Alphaproteobacteria bacterium]MBL7097102.1 hypothetical protein [Alphaproteobacteria bacterium]
MSWDACGAAPNYIMRLLECWPATSSTLTAVGLAVGGAALTAVGLGLRWAWRTLQAIRRRHKNTRVFLLNAQIGLRDVLANIRSRQAWLAGETAIGPGGGPTFVNQIALTLPRFYEHYMQANRGWVPGDLVRRDYLRVAAMATAIWDYNNLRFSEALTGGDLQPSGWTALQQRWLARLAALEGEATSLETWLRRKVG